MEFLMFGLGLVAGIPLGMYIRGWLIRFAFAETDYRDAGALRNLRPTADCGIDDN